MRIGKLVAVAATGLVALGACANVQGAAVFVGDERISEMTVDEYVDEYAELETEASGASLDEYDYSTTRQFVVSYVVLAELGRKLELEPPADQPEGLEGIYAEGAAYLNTLREQSEPRELTEAEIEAITVEAQQNQELAQALQQNPAQFAALAGLADDLNGYIEEYDVSASPRYGDVAITLVPGVWEIGIPQR